MFIEDGSSRIKLFVTDFVVNAILTRVSTRWVQPNAHPEGKIAHSVLMVGYVASPLLLLLLLFLLFLLLV